MAKIPAKCPKCGRTKAWQEVINPSRSGIPTRFGRVRVGIVVKGLFAKPIQRALGFYKVTYKCSKCGHQEEFDLPQ